MKPLARMVILVFAPLLMAALWMDQQPTFKPYAEPVLVPPVTAVPFSGTAIVSPAADLQNPVTASVASLAQGKTLFANNCALCHGETSLQPGLVGNKLKPPPPGLNRELLKERSDSQLFKAISNGFGRMPPFKSKLAPLERWHLVNFLRTRQ
jgi:mono/diheme cytochrome c family protein